MASTEQSPLHIAKEPAGLFAQTTLQPAVTLMAIGLIGWGALGLVYGDFGLTWQPVPAGFPARAAFAYAAGALEIALGLGLLFPVTRAWAVRILFPFLIAWQLLKLPGLMAGYKIEGAWLSWGEIAVLLAGGWTLFARCADLPPGSIFNFATGDGSARLARYYLALWIIPIGLSHFVYAQATYLLVPGWLPFRAGWGYLTGAGQIASGLGLLFGVLPRFAAWAEAGQISIYTLLIWVPAVFSPVNKDIAAVFGPGDYRRTCWTALFISWVIAAGAWAVALNVPRNAREMPARDRLP